MAEALRPHDIGLLTKKQSAERLGLTSFEFNHIAGAVPHIVIGTPTGRNKVVKRLYRIEGVDAVPQELILFAREEQKRQMVINQEKARATRAANRRKPRVQP